MSSASAARRKGLKDSRSSPFIPPVCEPCPTPARESPKSRRRGAAGRTIRHDCETSLLEEAYALRTIEELSGHKDPPTTTIYTHLHGGGGVLVRRPACRVTPSAGTRSLDRVREGARSPCRATPHRFAVNLPLAVGPGRTQVGWRHGPATNSRIPAEPDSLPRLREPAGYAEL
ncbi:MAG: tyrosine-type recombinase/integrase [Planctomycetaceae bacterium]